MKVNGQLEKAQFEQIAATSTTPAATGRVYMDITNPLAAIPTVFNGTTWRQIVLGQSSNLISQNSGSAVTVDWSQGLNQQIVLTGNCLISFSNPQGGQTHTLIVEQASSNTNYTYKLNMIDQDCSGKNYQPVGILSNTRNAYYSWFYKSTIRVGYATIPLQTMYLAPVTAATGVAIASNSKFAISARSSSPYAQHFGVIDNALLNGNCFTTMPDVSSALVAQTVGIDYSPDCRTVFTVSGTSPYIQASYLDASGTIVGQYADPGTLPTGLAKCVAVHPNGLFVGVGHATSPFMSIYPWVGNIWGTKLSNPSSLPAAQVNSIAFSPMGDYLAAASQTTPFIQVWAFTGSVIGGSIGAVSSNPTVLPAGGPAGAIGKGIAWRPQGDYVAMAMTVSPYLYVVPFTRSTGVFGTPLTITALSGAAKCVQWSPDGQYLIVGTGTSPYLYVYDFSAFSVGTAITFDGSNPGQQVNDISVHPSGDWMLLGLNGGVFAVGYSLPTKARNYLKVIG